MWEGGLGAFKAAQHREGSAAVRSLYSATVGALEAAEDGLRALAPSVEQVPAGDADFEEGDDAALREPRVEGL